MFALLPIMPRYAQICPWHSLVSQHVQSAVVENTCGEETVFRVVNTFLCECRSLESIYAAFIKGFFYNGTFPERECDQLPLPNLHTLVHFHDVLGLLVQVLGEC